MPTLTMSNETAPAKRSYTKRKAIVENKKALNPPPPVAVEMSQDNDAQSISLDDDAFIANEAQTQQAIPLDDDAATEDLPPPATTHNATVTAEDAAAYALAEILDTKRNLVAIRKEHEELKARHAEIEKESEMKINAEEERFRGMTTALNESLFV